jgi:hypothetical protein
MFGLGQRRVATGAWSSPGGEQNRHQGVGLNMKQVRATRLRTSRGVELALTFVRIGLLIGASFLSLCLNFGSDIALLGRDSVGRSCWGFNGRRGRVNLIGSLVGHFSTYWRAPLSYRRCRNDRASCHGTEWLAEPDELAWWRREVPRRVCVQRSKRT